LAKDNLEKVPCEKDVLLLSRVNIPKPELKAFGGGLAY